MRIIFFAGKGGVGKTSVAAATGIKSALMGHRTVVMSLDVAHSLADIFDLDRGLLDQNKGQPIKVSDNLWIQELDIQEEIKRYWGDIHKYLSGLLNRTGLDEVLAEELAVFPGMEEVSLLLYINKYVREKEYDVILLDCAPTGESLRFISIPTTLEWYMKKIFKLERTVVKYVRPVAKRVYDVPLPGDEYFQAIEDLFEKLKGVDQILVDPKITTVRLVTNPEKVVLKETQRAFMYFCLYKMSIDAIIMNRILPENVRETYFKGWVKGQQRNVEEATEFFNPVPIFPVNLFAGEIIGYNHLQELADQIYADRNPLERFFKDEPYQLIKEDGNYRLKMKLPFVLKTDVELSKLYEELVIRIGSFKRHILLPRQVASLNSVTAKMDGEHLSVVFEGDEHG
ncbi:MAG: ArsA family ATPase [Desulfobacterales bacterium]|nr:TRC40/GET3/ArsA family transport-energizing ATPase [Deltaproteobacteria bacterium]NNL77437.1 ArsA family ATPase [Desulfobacterales bacterium]